MEKKNARRKSEDNNANASEIRMKFQAHFSRQKAATIMQKPVTTNGHAKSAFRAKKPGN